MLLRSEDVLASYVEALHSIIYINHFDTYVVDKMIANIANDAKILEFNNAFGAINFENKAPCYDCDLYKFLNLIRDDGFDNNIFIILRDVHQELTNPKVIALLKRIAEDNMYRDNYNATIFVVGTQILIPKELENYITIFDFPLPDSQEIKTIIDKFVESVKINIEDDTKGDMIVSFKGLNEFQIKHILNLAYQDGGYIDKNDKRLILKEKEQFVKKSSMLEIVSFTENIEDIGGLENLKEYLGKKSKVFNNIDRAMKFGVDVPKGIMIVGMPGCGKSLTAKATANLFDIPLVRLDVGRLLGKYVGESENNMRVALQLAEAISPCVLWVDEIEKAFSGIGSVNSSDVTTRLFGQFLTWLQEKENTVYIVATANDISQIPPEFLRKGRFDELFFVDLPNEEERRKILEIHLEKRKKLRPSINLDTLAVETEGYNGADLEAVVKEAIEAAFINKQDKINFSDLLTAINETKSITSILGDKIKKIREEINKNDVKPASKQCKGSGIGE